MNLTYSALELAALPHSTGIVLSASALLLGTVWLTRMLQPQRVRWQRVAQTLRYRNHYELGPIVQRFSQELGALREQEDVVNLLLDGLLETLALSGVAFVGLPEGLDPGMLRLIEPEDLRARGDFVSPEASVAVLRGLISVDLAVSQLSWPTPLLLDPWPGCAALVLIGPARGGLGLGLLVVGPKHAGGSLRRDDRMLLVTLAHQAGTALENAVLVAGLRTSLAQVEVSTKQLVAARAEQQLLLRELVNADERQRAALARDLHDDALQEVLYLIRHSRLCAELVTTLDAQAAPGEGPTVLAGNRAPKNAALVRLTTELAQLAERSAVVEQRLRALCMGLYPALLHSLGLPAALDDLAKEHVPATGLRVSVSCPDDALNVAERLEPETALHMYRIAQEGLRNAGKHAGASEARVRLVLLRELGSAPPGHHASMHPALQLDIEDNGHGIPLPIDYAALLAAGHLGLAGIRERAQRIGGTLDVQSAVGGGARIRLLVPVDSASMHPTPKEARIVQREKGDRQ